MARWPPRIGYHVLMSSHLAPIDAASLLAESRILLHRIPELPAPIRPATEVAAYSAQSSLVEKILAHYGGQTIGYKIACTNAVAQRQLSVNGPFYGHLLAPLCFDSPARIAASRFSMRVIEAEFAFRLGRDLPPGPVRTREQVAEAVDAVLPGIEIVDSRYESWTTVGVLSLIADNACNGAWVKGDAIPTWRAFDLAAQTVKLIVNGQILKEGSGAAVLGHPLNALQWLVETLNAKGLGLQAGQYVTTGVTTGVYEAHAGDRIRAEFGPVGSVSVDFD